MPGNGTSWVATPAASPSIATSVAVSNPSPKRRPSGYICQLDRIRDPSLPRNSLLRRPRSSRRRSRRRRSYEPAPTSTRMRTTSARTSRLMMPMIQRKVPETVAPTYAPEL